MTKSELIAKIKKIAPQALSSVNKAEVSAVEYDELTSFPALKDVIVDLLTSDYGKFIDSIDWVAPKPTTFRVVFLNDEFIYLIYHTRLLRNGSKVDDTEAADVEGSEDISTDDIEVEVSDTEEVV